MDDTDTEPSWRFPMLSDMVDNPTPEALEREAEIYPDDEPIGIYFVHSADLNKPPEERTYDRKALWTPDGWDPSSEECFTQVVPYPTLLSQFDRAFGGISLVVFYPDDVPGRVTINEMEIPIGDAPIGIYSRSADEFAKPPEERTYERRALWTPDGWHLSSHWPTVRDAPAERTVQAFALRFQGRTALVAHPEDVPGNVIVPQREDTVEAVYIDVELCTEE